MSATRGATRSLLAVDEAATQPSQSQMARAKLHQEIDEIMDELKVEEGETFMGMQIDLGIDEETTPGVRRLCFIRLVPVDQTADGVLSRRIAR